MLRALALCLPSLKHWNSFNGNKYVIADFQYELLTGAGFTVERKGVASVTQVRLEPTCCC